MNEECLKVPNDFLLEIWRLNTAKKKKNVLNDSNAVFIYLGAKKRKKVMETPFFFSSCKTQQQKQRRGLIKPIEMLNLEERVMYGL